MKIRKNTPHKQWAPIVLTGLTIWSSHTLAYDYFDLSLEQLLDTKVLSVSKKDETIADAHAAIYVVTNEDIMRSGVTSVPDALRLVPGVNVAKSDSNSWAISIRGFNSVLANKLLVLIDGRTVYNPVFGGVLWEAQNMMLTDIDRIEVIRGPGGTLWGANAVNGVINIITKKSSDTQGNIVNFLSGNEEQNVSARHGGTLPNNGNYRVYVKAFKKDSSHHPVRDHTYDNWDGFRTGFRADWNDKFMFQGDAYRTNTQQRRQHFSLTPPYMPVENQKLVYEGVSLLGRWIEQQESGSQFSLQTYIDWARRDEPLNFIDDRMTYDIEAQYNFAPMEIHELIAGAGFRYMDDEKTGNENVSFSPANLQSNLYNIFVQDKITLSPEKWFLTLGTKYEHNDFSGSEIQPNIRLQWQPSDSQTWWSAISRAVRTPTPIEEDLTSTLGTAAGARVAIVPNEEAKSEKLIAYELGYRNQLTDELSADVATFYNDYERLQTLEFQSLILVNNGTDPLHYLIPIKFANSMQGNSHGVETAITWMPNTDLKLALNCTWLQMSLESDIANQEGAEQLHPDYQFGFKSFWNIGSNWRLDTSIIHIAELSTITDDYTKLDINLSWQVQKDLRLSLVGQNLLEKYHGEFGSTADINSGEMERSIFGKVTWTF
jgi:iron complex outermembrane recepter protein